MIPVEKTFNKIGNSYGLIFDKFVFTQSEIKPTDTVEITFAKNRITIKKKENKKKGD